MILNNDGASVLAKLLAGVPDDKVAIDGLDEPWARLAQTVVTANGQGRLAAFEAELACRPDGDEIRTAVFAVEARSDAPEGDQTAEADESTPTRSPQALQEWRASGAAPWPDPLAPEAYHGLMGRLVRAIGP